MFVLCSGCGLLVLGGWFWVVRGWVLFVCLCFIIGGCCDLFVWFCVVGCFALWWWIYDLRDVVLFLHARLWVLRLRLHAGLVYVCGVWF